MLQITAEWVEKAEADFATAQREIAVTQRANYDAVCFHAQQCIEKYLKAFLRESNVSFPRTHDLADLLGLALPIGPTKSLPVIVRLRRAEALSGAVPGGRTRRRRPRDRSS